MVSGKTAIVTGAGSGINLAFAELLLSRNCNVIFADLALRPEAQDLVSRYASRHKSPRAIYVETDVTSWPALSHMFDTALTEFGDFHIVCPGAGVYEPTWSSFWRPPGSRESKDTMESGHYALMDINLTHPIRATQMAISHWLYPKSMPNSKFPIVAKTTPSNPKRIIHIASVAAQVPVFRAPLYAASKFAISGFVRSLGGLDTYGVRVNAVAPGFVRTPLWTENPDKLANIDENRDVWVTPLEVAEAMLSCIESEDKVGGTVIETF
ncbi:short chain dehydrogenase domain-containing protein [Hirsutella rhossiliensis]|uniref:Short chain dehydrogenase domain-containing protein n=1 Tax=Hirsutella rhossiliensis TaxID=111463 RepID=A0A9P8MZD6_9HYPO|nr:short chain dehydrogenase domain-containing protein [Hirsutella rhossiliensis]KAH0963787.1 short chain dehydrogenase domain-containing protein [Hirsutella rhossiliensis]